MPVIPPELLDVLKGLGVAGGPLFLMLWLMERSERKESIADLLTDLKAERAENRLVQEKSAEVIVGLKTTLDLLVRIFGAPK